jgi:hypothetical protein
MACALIVFIVYGATTEAAHTHNSFPLSSFAQEAVSVTGQTDSTAKQLPRGSECLVCRFQQHLFSGLFHDPSSAIMPPAACLYVPTYAVAYLSTMHTPRTGRAPPAFSLI